MLKNETTLRTSVLVTVDFYWDCWNSFKRYGGELTETGLGKYVVAMREAEGERVSCRAFISGIKAYLDWLHENGHLPEQLKIQKHSRSTIARQLRSAPVMSTAEKDTERREEIHKVIIAQTRHKFIGDVQRLDFP